MGPRHCGDRAIGHPACDPRRSSYHTCTGRSVCGWHFVIGRVYRCGAALHHLVPANKDEARQLLDRGRAAVAVMVPNGWTSGYPWTGAGPAMRRSVINTPADILQHSPATAEARADFLDVVPRTGYS
jgi:hypothetical protein